MPLAYESKAMWARLTMPDPAAPPAAAAPDGGEAAALAAFDDRYARYRADRDALMAANRRSAFDLVSPPADHRPLAARIAAWLGECSAHGSHAATLAAAGRPALQTRVAAATVEATSALAIVGGMVAVGGAAAVAQATIFATAHAEGLATLGRLSAEFAAATDPLNPARR